VKSRLRRLYAGKSPVIFPESARMTFIAKKKLHVFQLNIEKGL
jgi:hypothetical protein